MTNQNPNQFFDCETYEPLISAMIDGELDSTELNELQGHLHQCEGCREQVQAFAKVNSAIESLGHPAVTQNNVSVTSALQSSRSKSKETISKSQRVSLWSMKRLIPMAVAATLLACLGIAIWPNSQPANASPISPEQIVGPMQELQSLNFQKERDQNLMLRTLGMDLRSMKLEINQLEPGSVDRETLAAQIDAMIEKVKTFESNSKTNH